MSVFDVVNCDLRFCACVNNPLFLSGMRSELKKSAVHNKTPVYKNGSSNYAICRI